MLGPTSHQDRTAVTEHRCTRHRAEAVGGRMCGTCRCRRKRCSSQSRRCGTRTRLRAEYCAGTFNSKNKILTQIPYVLSASEYPFRRKGRKEEHARKIETMLELIPTRVESPDREFQHRISFLCTSFAFFAPFAPLRRVFLLNLPYATMPAQRTPGAAHVR
jgi:hypothetical protein